MNTNKGYGIIPNTVLFDDNLTSTQKLLYVYISGLTAQEGYCFASNGAIAKKFAVTPKTISEAISSLRDNEYLYIEEGEKGRKIFLSPITKISTPLEKNVIHNNTTNINIISKDIIEDKPSNNRTLLINSLLSLFHTETTKRGLTIVRDNKFDRIFCNHIINNKDIAELSKGEQRRSELLLRFVVKVISAADELDFWKNKILTPKSFYYNYAKVMNEYKTKLGKNIVSKPKINIDDFTF